MNWYVLDHNRKLKGNAVYVQTNKHGEQRFMCTIINQACNSTWTCTRTPRNEITAGTTPARLLLLLGPSVALFSFYLSHLCVHGVSMSIDRCQIWSALQDSICLRYPLDVSSETQTDNRWACENWERFFCVHWFLIQRKFTQYFTGYAELRCVCLGLAVNGLSDT